MLDHFWALKTNCIRSQCLCELLALYICPYVVYMSYCKYATLHFFYTFIFLSMHLFKSIIVFFFFLKSTLNIFKGIRSLSLPESILYLQSVIFDYFLFFAIITDNTLLFIIALTCLMDYPTPFSASLMWHQSGVVSAFPFKVVCMLTSFAIFSKCWTRFNHCTPAPTFS